MYYFIVNPNAHGGQGRRIWRKLERRLERSGISYDARLTQAPGDAGKWATELTRDCRDPRTIVVVGGDGTVNEVLNGLSFSCPVTMGHIPVGAGTDLGRGLKLPRNPKRCLRRILKPKTYYNLDYGILSYETGQPVHRRFAVSSGIGLDAAVCHDVLDHIKRSSPLVRIGGRLSYVVIGLKQLMLAKPVSGYLVLDGEKKVEFNHIWFVSTHIHPCEGGGFQFAPKADPESGQLELCVVHGTSRLRLLPVLVAAWFRRMGRRKGVRFFRCREAKIHVNCPLPVHTDGESCFCQMDIALRCVEGKLKMLV